WITSHPRGVYTDRDGMLAHLAAYESTLDAREDKMLALLAQWPGRLEVRVVVGLGYPEDHESPKAAPIAMRTVFQHLDELLAAGRVTRRDDGAWRLAGH